MDKIMQINQRMNDAEWAERIKECRSSGKSVTEWCRESGISPKTYYYHLRKARSELCEQYPMAVAEITGTQKESVSIHYGEITIEIPASVSAEYLVSVVQALKC